MELIDPQQLAEVILNAPSWALLGVGMSDRHTRQRAAQELAATIIKQVSLAQPEPEDGQLRLAI